MSEPISVTNIDSFPCQGCGRMSRTFFIASGGYLCRSCKEKAPDPATELAALRAEVAELRAIRARLAAAYGCEIALARAKRGYAFDGDDAIWKIALGKSRAARGRLTKDELAMIERHEMADPAHARATPAGDPAPAADVRAAARALSSVVGLPLGAPWWTPWMEAGLVEWHLGGHRLAFTALGQQLVERERGGRDGE